MIIREITIICMVLNQLNEISTYFKHNITASIEKKRMYNKGTHNNEILLYVLKTDYSLYIQS